MARIMDLITNADEVWAIKDEAKQDNVLLKDPMMMNRREFKMYCQAKARASWAAHKLNGRSDKQAAAYVRRHLATLDTNWRVAAKAYNERQAVESSS